MFEDDRLEVLYLNQTFQDSRKFGASKSTVIEEHSIHLLMVDVLTCFCDALAVSLTEIVVLQAQCLLVDLFKDWQ